MLQGVHQPISISTAITTTISTNSFIYLNVNKTLTGTVVITETTGGKAIASYAIGTTPQTFIFKCAVNGLTVVTSAADNITIVI